MENRSHALLAGLFVLLLGACAVAALWWFGGKREPTNEYVVVTHKNINGLNLQAQVRYRAACASARSNRSNSTPTTWRRR